MIVLVHAFHAISLYEYATATIAFHITEDARVEMRAEKENIPKLKKIQEHRWLLIGLGVAICGAVHVGGGDLVGLLTVISAGALAMYHLLLRRDIMEIYDFK